MKIFPKAWMGATIRARIVSLALLASHVLSCDLPIIEPTNPDPASSFSYTAFDGPCASGCEVSFTNQSQNAKAYQWNFGDESPLSDAVNPVHTYATPGTYSVSLKAINDVGEDDTTLMVHLVSSTTVSSVACFTVTNNNCVAPCTIGFTNCSTNSDSYQWNFGDGSAVDTTADPSHVYTTAGSFEVSLTATNASGSDDISATVTVTVGAPNPDIMVHTANAGNISVQLTRIDSDLTDNKPGKILIVTPVVGLRNDATLGVYYYANQWYIFNEDKSSIVDGEKFNVMVAEPDDSYAFVHQTSAANIRSGYISTIDHALTNNNPNARIFVTPVWETLSDYVINPLGVVYINNRWEIVNMSKVTLPAGVKFNVVVWPNNDESFVHTTSVSTIVADYTMMDDASLNFKPTLKVFTTPNLGTDAGSVINPRQTGVWYRVSQDKWTVINESGQAMPQGARFNILAFE